MDEDHMRTKVRYFPNPVKVKVGILQSRYELLEKARGKTVLNCGCVDEGIYDEGWLHGKLATVAKKLVGFDIQKEQIKKLKQQGFDVVYGNAETINLHQKFDVIFAGEIIEHLPNQGIFLQNMKRHLNPNGIMVISTPNAFSLGYLLDHTRRGHIRRYGAHVLWHTFDTMIALAEKYGFEIVEFYWLQGKPRGFRDYLWKMVLKLFPFLSSHLIFVFKIKK